MKKVSVARYALFFSLLFFLDRITKFAALVYLHKQEFNPFSGLRLALFWNKGVTFSLFASDSTVRFYLLLSIIFCVILAFLAYTMREYRRGTLIWFEVAVLGGAISNLIDRLIFGGVIDFIDLYIGNWHWPAFNIADTLIVCGVAGIIAKTWLGALHEHKKTIH